MLFENRLDAAMQLIPLLKKYTGEDAVVLAIPRGAVPMGYCIAKALELPLDILLTKKIGHPGNPELAVGSVSLEGSVTDPRFDVDPDYLEHEILRIRAMLRERYTKFMGQRTPVAWTGKTLIIVDDGIATGNTMLASIDLVRRHAPGKVVVAIPVAAEAALQLLKRKADEVVCLDAPDDFFAVGEYYRDFSEVTDEDVIECLQQYDQDRGR